MANRMFVPVRGKRIRITTLDNCGRVPEAGSADAFIVSKGFISAKLSSVVEEGPEITERGIDGSICVSEKSPDSLKRMGLELTFCGVNPALIPMVSNAEGYFDAAGDNAGFTISEGDIEKWFSFELWTGIAGGACDPEEQAASGYMLTPFVQAGTIGDITVDGENAVNFTMTGAYTKGGNAWGSGPYHVVLDGTAEPAFLPTPLNPLTHFLMLRTGLLYPPLADDPQPMVTGGTSTTTTTAA